MMSIAGSDFALGATGGGSGPTNAVVARTFPFTSSTPGLFTPGTGWAFYTGVAGEIIYDVVVEIDNLCGSSPALMDVTTNMGVGLTGYLHLVSGGGWNVASGSGGNVTAIFTGFTTYANNAGNPPKSLALAANQATVLLANTNQAGPPYKLAPGQQLFLYCTQTGVTTGAAVTTPSPCSGTVYVLKAVPS